MYPRPEEVGSHAHLVKKARALNMWPGVGNETSFDSESIMSLQIKLTGTILKHKWRMKATPQPLVLLCQPPTTLLVCGYLPES